MENNKIKELSFVDFIVLSVIFFGYATYTSVLIYQYQNYQNFQVFPSGLLRFDDDSNIDSIIMEVVLLCLAGIYLYIRKFDFSVLRFSVDKKTVPLILLLIVLGSLFSDLVWLVSQWIFPSEESVTTTQESVYGMVEHSKSDVFGNVTLLLVIFSLLNGFYEELFFMGLVFVVKEKSRFYAILGSLFVRFIFHIYQGVVSAMGIMMMGLLFIMMRRKIKTLTPFMLAHAFFDVFGLGIYYWVYTFYLT